MHLSRYSKACFELSLLCIFLIFSSTNSSGTDNNNNNKKKIPSRVKRYKLYMLMIICIELFSCVFM